jgi:hypothetical protein
VGPTYAQALCAARSPDHDSLHLYTNTCTLDHALRLLQFRKALGFEVHARPMLEHAMSKQGVALPARRVKHFQPPILSLPATYFRKLVSCQRNTRTKSCLEYCFAIPLVLLSSIQPRILPQTPHAIVPILQWGT